eukprot:scaffold8705_cov140-Amphora_coffeaeformis.AAC.7
MAGTRTMNAILWIMALLWISDLPLASTTETTTNQRRESRLKQIQRRRQKVTAHRRDKGAVFSAVVDYVNKDGHHGSNPSPKPPKPMKSANAIRTMVVPPEYLKPGAAGAALNSIPTTPAPSTRVVPMNYNQAQNKPMAAFKDPGHQYDPVYHERQPYEGGQYYYPMNVFKGKGKGKGATPAPLPKLWDRIPSSEDQKSNEIPFGIWPRFANTPAPNPVTIFPTNSAASEPPEPTDPPTMAVMTGLPTLSVITDGPTASPTTSPTALPTTSPTSQPSTSVPTAVPSTSAPTTAAPTTTTTSPTSSTSAPTLTPTMVPTEGNTTEPTTVPTVVNTTAPTPSTEVPTVANNTAAPTSSNETLAPTLEPTNSTNVTTTDVPTLAPSNVTGANVTTTDAPTLAPTNVTGANVTTTDAPTLAPTNGTEDVTTPAPTVSPNSTTLAPSTVTNETETTDTPTLSPTNVTEDTTTSAPTVSPNATTFAPSAVTNETETTDTPTFAPTNVTADTTTSAPTVSPNVTTFAPSAVANETENGNGTEAVLQPFTASIQVPNTDISVSVDFEVIPDAGAVEITVTAEGTRWLAVGSSPANTMPGTTACISKADGNNPMLYEISGRSEQAITEAPTQNLLTTSFTQDDSNSVLVCRIPIDLSEGFAFSSTEATPLVVAWGEDNTFGYHGTNRANNLSVVLQPNAVGALFGR